jgi:hypothetical protein
MKKIIPFAFLFFITACNDSDKSGSENDVDAARNFINAALAGDYNKARSFMLRDSANEEHMNLIERVNLSPDEKKGLAGATINIHTIKKLNDSSTVVIYSNSFKNNWDTLKVVRNEGQWLVDFDYLFDHDSDTLAFPSVKKDSLPK